MKQEARVAVPPLKLVKTRAGRCDLNVADQVISDTTVGNDFSTREPVHAGCAGVVEAVNWSADGHAFSVWVRPCQSSGAEHGPGAL